MSVKKCKRAKKIKAKGLKTEKSVLHPRNVHQGRYDLIALSQTCPSLKQYIIQNPRGEDTIDFSNEEAVRCLNKSLLAHFYNVENWDIPPGFLCPPIPGRADYIHYVADLLAKSDETDKKNNHSVRVLDIGTGANCIYPIIGSQSYGWHFVASDINPESVRSAKLIVASNPGFEDMIQVVEQPNAQSIFKGLIHPGDWFDLTICNPPFHASMEDAMAGSKRKLKNLSGKKLKAKQVKLNFGGQENELWCPGGELGFIKRMINESVIYSKQVGWFTCLVSKSENLRPLKKRLITLGVSKIEVVKMSQGQKQSRFIAWRFS